jgi:hypothetical protein
MIIKFKAKQMLIVLPVVVIIAAAVFVYFFNPFAFLMPRADTRIQTISTLGPQTKIQADSLWGVDFSQSQAEYLKLDWKETYSAIISDLGAKSIKLHTNWNWVEGKKDNYFFNDIDWQLKQAEQNNVKIIYVLGMKTGRWPECHLPDWALNIPKDQQQSELLKYMTAVIDRYKGSKAIAYWQVENEPFLKFGNCPSWYYNDDTFLKTEVALVRSLDPSRQIIISDSGELSDWTRVAKLADIVGITMYRSAWTKVTQTFGFETYSFKVPSYYSKKAANIQKLFGKKVICIELQAEPWASEPLLDAPLSEQSKSMNLSMFKEDVAFARQTGLDKFYFWGVEWWYWMATKQNQPAIWNEAKNLFHGGSL